MAWAARLYSLRRCAGWPWQGPCRVIPRTMSPRAARAAYRRYMELSCRMLPASRTTLEWLEETDIMGAAMRRLARVRSSSLAHQDRAALRRLQKADRNSERACHRVTTATIDFISALGRALFTPASPRDARARAPALRSSPGWAPARASARSSRGSTPRPADAKGRVTIHFSVERLTKGSPAGTAAGHQDYVERDYAQEVLPPYQQTADPVAAHAHDAGRHQPYLERDGATDRIEPRGTYWQPNANMPVEMNDGICVLGNIGEKIQDRRHFWNTVDAYENTPGPGHLRIYVTPETWSALQDRSDFPPVLRSAKLSKFPKRRGRSDAVDVGTADDAPPLDGIQLWRLDRKLPGSDRAEAWLRSVLPDADQDLKHEAGRGGTIQYRIIAELPHELGSAERYTLVWEFTQVFRDRGLPYFAALHRPDPKKDSPLNWHLHCDYYDRPCVRDPRTGLWDIETDVKGPDGHPSYKHIPNKDRAVNSRDWIPALRQHMVQIANRHLAAAGHPKRYTAESYKDMGLDRAPGEHLGPARAAVTTDRQGKRTAAALAGLTTTLTAETEPYYQEILGRYLKRLTDIGYSLDRDPNHPAARDRFHEFHELARRQAERARRRKQHQKAVALAKGKLAAEHRRLTAEIAQKEKQQATDPASIRSPAGFETRLSALRKRLADVETQVTTIDLKDKETWARLEADVGGDGTAERRRMATLLRQLDRLRNLTFDPAAQADVDRRWRDNIAAASLAAQDALVPQVPPDILRPSIPATTPTPNPNPNPTPTPTPTSPPTPTSSPAPLPASQPTPAPRRHTPRRPNFRPPIAT